MNKQTNHEAARAEFWAGVRDQIPILLGVIPFGLIFGALAISVGISPLAAQGFSLFVFAGSSQFIAVGLIGEMAPAVIIVATIFVVNLRHALYSASTGELAVGNAFAVFVERTDGLQPTAVVPTPLDHQRVVPEDWTQEP